MTKCRLQLFYEEHDHLMQNKVLKSFLQSNDNEKILEQVLIDPSDENINLLDKQFKAYFLKIKIIKYISSLIHYYTIDFDKRNNKRNRHFMLILDAPVQPEQGDSRSFTDIQASLQTTEHYLFENRQTLHDVLENTELYNAYQNLTSKQKTVLDFIYLHGYSTKDIAQMYKDTPQNISNIHKRALKKMREAYTDDWG